MLRHIAYRTPRQKLPTKHRGNPVSGDGSKDRCLGNGLLVQTALLKRASAWEVLAVFANLPNRGLLGESSGSFKLPVPSEDPNRVAGLSQWFTRTKAGDLTIQAGNAKDLCPK